MPISILSRAAALLLLTAPIAGSGFASDTVDDEALLRAFESGLKEVLDTRSGLSAREIRKELRSEPHHVTALPSVKEDSTSWATHKIFQKARGATVMLGHLYLCADCEHLHGSISGGVVLSPDGLVLTNYHVLDFPRAHGFGAMLLTGEVFPIAKVLASSKKRDLALIQLQGASDLTFLPLAATPPIEGDSVWMVSHPDAHFYSLSSGTVSRYFLVPETKEPRLQISAPFARGSSGCAVVDEHAQIVGLAASTNSIYYEQEGDRQRDFQMAVNSCVTFATIVDFLAGKE